MNILNICDLEGCWEKIRLENGEPVFYDFDPDGIIEYVFCSKEHQLEWNKRCKYELPYEFEDDLIEGDRK